jgi:hypothetical protein
VLSIDKEKGEIAFSYDNSDGIPVQGKIGYFLIAKDRVAFTLTGQTVAASIPARDIGMFLSAIGNDLSVEAWKMIKAESGGAP